METLENLGELEILQRLKPYLSEPYLLHDDASAFLLTEKTIVLTNIDGFVKSTDMLPGMTYYHAGYKAALMATSDLVVKGITPQFLLASFNVPKTMTWQNIKHFMDGLTSFTKAHGISFLGGDFNSTTKDEVFDIVATGIGTKSSLISRVGGAIGDYVITKPLFGWTSLAYRHLLNNLPIHDTRIKNTTLTWAYTPPYDVTRELQAIHSLPVQASIDSSDGLARSLYELIKLNHYGIQITQLPIPEVLRVYLQSQGLSLEEFVFYGGEEYLPLLIISKAHASQIPPTYTIIGQIIEKQGVYYSSSKRNILLPNHGWEHFQQS